MAEQDVQQGVTEAVTSALGETGEEHPANEETQANGEAAVVSEDDQAGFDPTSPEARHWQSVADRRIAKLEASLGERLSKFEQQQAAQQLKTSREAGTSQVDNRAILDEIVGFDPGIIPDVPKDLQYALGDEASALLRNWFAEGLRNGGRAIIGNIDGVNQRAAQQMQQQSVQSKLTGFIGTLDGQKAEAFMPIYTQYQQLAESDPDGFIEFAKVKLGLNAKPNGTPQARQNLAGAVQASSTRPTANGMTQPRVQQPKTVRDGVTAAVQQALRRSGG
jgi:hypothetical protein